MDSVWFKAAAVRALKTFAETIVSAGIVLPSVSAGTDWLSVGWTIGTVFLSAAGAAFLSFMWSIKGLPETTKV